MVEKDTDLFKITNNFAKTADIPSIQIMKSNLDFKPKVTIAIPTYRRADLLKQTIDTAISQKEYENYDIIVVDNDPERNCATEKLMQSYNDKKISYYKNSENIGMTGNWNRLFELAEGDYVVMLHDDDILYPNYLSIINNLQKKKNFTLDAIYPLYNYFDNNITMDLPTQNLHKCIKYINLTYKDFALSNIIGAPVGVCFKKDKVLEIGGFDDSFYPSLDYAFYVKFSYFFKSIKMLNNELSIYRIHENESQNANTILGFIEKDNLIKCDIILNSFFKPLRKLFFFYNQFHAVVYLNNMSNLYNINKDLFPNMSLNFNLFKIFNFKFWNKIWSLKLKLKQNRINLS